MAAIVVILAAPVLLLPVVLGAILIAILVPAIVARRRGHHNALAITVLNAMLVIAYVALSATYEIHKPALTNDLVELLGLGVVLIGSVWLVAMIWACTAVRRTHVDARALGLGAVELALQK